MNSYTLAGEMKRFSLKKELLHPYAMQEGILKEISLSAVKFACIFKKNKQGGKFTKPGGEDFV